MMKKVFLIDDHPLIIESLKILFDEETGLEVCGFSTDPSEVLSEIQKTKPDVAVVDVSMPQIDGFELVPSLKKHFPELKIIMYTMHALDRYLSYFNDLNVDGYVLKSGEYGNIIQAIQTVLQGEKFFPLKHTLNQDQMEENQIQFNNQEKEILNCLIDNLSNQEIASKLNKDLEFIMISRRQMLLKSGSTNTTDLIEKYRRI